MFLITYRWVYPLRAHINLEQLIDDLLGGKRHKMLRQSKENTELNVVFSETATRTFFFVLFLFN